QEFERAGVPEAVRKIALHAWFGDELVQHMLPPRTTDDINAFVPDVVRMLVGDLIVTRAGDEALSPVPNDFRSQLQQFHEQVAEAESRLAQLPSEARLRALGTAVRAMQDLRSYVGRLEFADESFTRLLRQMAGEGFLVPGLRLVADAARMSWPDGVPPATNPEVLPEAVQQAVATVRSILDAWIATTPRPQPRMRLRGGAPGENLFRRLAGHFSRHRNEGEGAPNRWRRMGQRFNRLRRGESVVEAGPSEPVTSRSTGAQSPEAEVRERVPVRLPGTVLTESADGQWVLERLRDVTAANHPDLQVGELWQTTGLHDVETLVNGAPTEHVNGILHDSTDGSSVFVYRRGTGVMVFAPGDGQGHPLRVLDPTHEYHAFLVNGDGRIYFGSEHPTADADDSSSSTDAFPNIVISEAGPSAAEQSAARPASPPSSAGSRVDHLLSRLSLSR